jgi:oxygen-independent coproporphyrinogen-3 oxidase
MASPILVICILGQFNTKAGVRQESLIVLCKARHDDPVGHPAIPTHKGIPKKPSPPMDGESKKRDILPDQAIRLERKCEDPKYRRKMPYYAPRPVPTVCRFICRLQDGLFRLSRSMIASVNPSGFAMYLHIPFCDRRCRYCDFFSTAGMHRHLPAYVSALAREVRFVGQTGDTPRIVSVYFGGGTPSLLSPAQVERILHAAGGSYAMPDTGEITLEVNPGTVDRGKLAGYHAAGINRLSLGMQSADESELHLLGRIHSDAETGRAYDDARRAGFDNISLDLIFGLPGQSPAAWRKTLRRAADLAPEHLSLYALTLERGTELARKVRKGALPSPDEDRSADMYELAEEQLAAAGYRHYEISSWARDGAPAGDGRFPKFASRHNLQYWLNLPYLGLGAGAHGCADGRRYANIRSVGQYIARMRCDSTRRFPLTPAATRSRIRSREEEMHETMWLGLRLTEAGVDRPDFQARFGEDLQHLFGQQIEESIADGLLEWSPNGACLRLTGRGRLLGNRVFSKFV